MKLNGLEVTRMRLADLTAAPYNPRKISNAQLAALQQSVREFGLVEPIVFNRQTGHVVGGHQRILALHADGQVDTDVLIVDIAEEREKLLNVALNKISGEWDDPKLAELFAELEAAGADLKLTGFDEKEIAQLLAANGGAEGLTDPDEVPDNAETRCKVGDLWLCGKHRLLCGDSTKADDVARVMGNERADMVFTDPPYGVSIGAKNRMLNSFQEAGRNLKDIESDDCSPEELKALLVPAFKNVRDSMDESCTVFVTAPQGGELGMMMMMMQEAGLRVRHVLIWKKNAPTFSMGRLDYDYQHEPILLTWGKRHNYYGAGQHRTSVWEIDKPRESKLHPTMKPVALIENAMLNNSKADDVVLDPFLGSGTTMIAAEQLNRRCFGIEIDLHYCDVILARWERFTGQQATLSN